MAKKKNFEDMRNELKQIISFTRVDLSAWEEIFTCVLKQIFVRKGNRQSMTRKKDKKNIRDYCNYRISNRNRWIYYWINLVVVK